MMWLFAILVVLVMGAVAAVAAGKGAPMVEVHPDRPDATVPADGPLTAEDLRRVRFSLAFRGYRMSEVDALLQRLAAEREAPAVTGAGTGAVTGAATGAEGGAATSAGTEDVDAPQGGAHPTGPEGRPGHAEA